jgi:hypothetical protein
MEKPDLRVVRFLYRFTMFSRRFTMTARYQVLLVQEDRDRQGAATLLPAPFASCDPAAAKIFADAFNERELADPLGFWAVVSVGPED